LTATFQWDVSVEPPLKGGLSEAPESGPGNSKFVLIMIGPSHRDQPEARSDSLWRRRLGLGQRETRGRDPGPRLPDADWGTNNKGQSRGRSAHPASRVSVKGEG
jgi:hypothetical protein